MTTPPTWPRAMTLPRLAARAQCDADWRARAWATCLSALLIGGGSTLAHAADPGAAGAKPAASAPEAAPAEDKVDLGNDIKKALRESLPGRKKFTLVISDKPELVLAQPQPAASAKTAPLGAPAVASSAPPTAPEVHAAPATAVRAPAVAARSQRVVPAVVKPQASRAALQARAAALAGAAPALADPADSSHGGDGHWSYAGANGPQAWGQLKPEFKTCAVGKRQTPIHIDDADTLQGPAEPLLFNYQPSNGVVVNTGHTIQVNVQGNNTLTVRGATYSLVQFHFHTPAEEQVNRRSFAMVAHLVHQNDQGQLAVLAVLLDPGQANALVDKVWTYMPLDVNDQVRMPAGLLDMDELLPQDQRYYQFMGSLSTPPCSEGVLWMVLKTPTQISQAQLRLFQQLYPNNARPIQAINNRPIRNAQ